MRLLEYLPIIELGILIILEYGSSSTGIIVTSSLSEWPPEGDLLELCCLADADPFILVLTQLVSFT